MTTRLSKSIIRGELDNRTRGQITGKLWLAGRQMPIILKLKGNCHPDLAGCRIHFHNPMPRPGDNVDLASLQEGRAGDISASRQFVPAILADPLWSRRAHAMRQASEQNEPDVKVGHPLYIEWISHQNGRVILAGYDFHVSISDHIWTLPERRKDTPEVPEPVHQMDEFEWEAFMKRSDEMAESYQQALTKYRHHPERERRIAEEMGWPVPEAQGDAPDFDSLLNDILLSSTDTEIRSPFQASQDYANADPGNAPIAPDADNHHESFDPLTPIPHTEGRDWVRDAVGDIHHPLTLEIRDFTVSVWQYVHSLELYQRISDSHVQGFMDSMDGFATRLTGALDDLAYDESPDYGFLVASLKRGLACLHDGLGHLQYAEERGFLTKRADVFRDSMFYLREEVLSLMDEYRTRLKARKTD